MQACSSWETLGCAAEPALQPPAQGHSLVPCSGAVRVKFTWAACTRAVWPHPGSPHPRESLLPASTQMQSHSKVSLLLKTDPEQHPWGHSSVGTKLPIAVCPIGVCTPHRSPVCVFRIGMLCILTPWGSVQGTSTCSHYSTMEPSAWLMPITAPCPYSQAVLQTMLCLTPGSCGASRSSAPSRDRRQQTQCRKSATLCRKSWRHGCRYWKKRSMK